MVAPPPSRPPPPTGTRSAPSSRPRPSRSRRSPTPASAARTSPPRADPRRTPQGPLTPSGVSGPCALLEVAASEVGAELAEHVGELLRVDHGGVDLEGRHARAVEEDPPLAARGRLRHLDLDARVGQ